jgi:outer membrane protein assembly factor BamB
MGKKVGNEKIKREDGYLYYIGKDGYVWASPMKHNKGGKKKKVGTEKIEKKKGYMYYVGKDGYVYEAKMKNA